MELSIRDFAKIQQADIVIDGITVIAGENNTGKSTVGKILFSLFNALSDVEEKIFNERMRELRSSSERIMSEYFDKDADHGGYGKPLSVHNLSTGIKSFAILKILLEKGCLKDKDVLILDEPEIHLHPQWQIVYIQFVRDNINYILVYNSNKYGKVANYPARESIYRYTFERAEEEEKLFDIDKFEQYLFKATHTYTPSLFEKNFILPKEHEEGIAVEN